MAIDTKRPAFLLTNYATSATITATEEATSHDADELKTASYAGSYRTTTVTADRIVTFDLGSTKSDLEAFVLWGTNFADSATREWETSNDAGFSPLIHNPGASAAFDVSRTPYVADAPPWGRPSIYLVTAGTSGRYVRVRASDTGNGDGYLEARHAFIGPVHQPSWFMAGQWTPGMEFVGPPGRSVPIVTHRITLRAVTEDDRHGVLSFARALMATGRFGFIPRTSDDSHWVREAVLCQLAGPVEELGFHAAEGIRWDLTMTLREIRG